MAWPSNGNARLKVSYPMVWFFTVFLISFAFFGIFVSAEERYCMAVLLHRKWTSLKRISFSYRFVEGLCENRVLQWLSIIFNVDQPALIVCMMMQTGRWIDHGQRELSFEHGLCAEHLPASCSQKRGSFHEPAVECLLTKTIYVSLCYEKTAIKYTTLLYL